MGEGNCTYEEHDYPRKVGGGRGSRSNAVPITFPPSQTFPAWEPSAPRMPLCRGREENVNQVLEICRKEALLKTPRNEEMLHFATRRGCWSAVEIPALDGSGGQDWRMPLLRAISVRKPVFPA